MTRLASIDVTTLTTTVPTGDDDGMRRMQKFAARDEDVYVNLKWPRGDGQIWPHLVTCRGVHN
jgi:hypothetical protein